MVRQELAWLSFSDLVHYSDTRGKWLPGPQQRTARPSPTREASMPEITRLLISADYAQTVLAKHNAED